MIYKSCIILVRENFRNFHINMLATIYADKHREAARVFEFQ